MDIESVDISTLNTDPGNTRAHSERNFETIRKSLLAFGQRKPIVVGENNVVQAGNGTLEAARSLGWDKIDIVRSPLKDGLARAYAIADNRSGDAEVGSEWKDNLAEALASLQKDEGLDHLATGFTDAEIDALIAGMTEPGAAESHQELQERFGVPPFSVLDARQGYWQDRKRAWLAMGIQSELGRGGRVFGQDLMRGEHVVGGGPRPHGKDNRPVGESGRGRYEGGDCWKAAHAEDMSGTSIFDPVLCELVYLWFCPPGGKVLDPFAGGSVRGIVAAKLGRGYTGVELRVEQVEANNKQGEDIMRDGSPKWIVGDARRVADLAKADYDLVFTCPPYGDLEVYSDDPADLSTMSYAEFIKAWWEIIAASCAMLRDDRFACVVVGEFRDKKGMYRGFVGDTVAAFRAAGLELYNDAVLVTAVGSLPLRSARSFAASRKLGKTHQNVLVFVKGDPVAATSAVGEVEFGDVEELKADVEVPNG